MYNYLVKKGKVELQQIIYHVNLKYLKNHAKGLKMNKLPLLDIIQDNFTLFTFKRYFIQCQNESDCQI